MITEEYLKDNFASAYFIDQDRNNIEVLTTTENKKKLFSTIIPYEEGHHQSVALQTKMNIDQLHEPTYQRNKLEQEQFEKSVLRIAEKEGLIFEFENKKLDTKFYPKILTALFEDNDNIDQIFALKLACFETKNISESSNNEAKKKIRQAKTKLDVLKAAIEIAEVSRVNAGD